MRDGTDSLELEGSGRFDIGKEEDSQEKGSYYLMMP